MKPTVYNLIVLASLWLRLLGFLNILVALLVVVCSALAFSEHENDYGLRFLIGGAAIGFVGFVLHWYASRMQQRTQESDRNPIS